MAKGLYIFGNNKLARLMVRYVAKYSDCEFLGFCVDREYLKNDTFAGYKNIAFEDIEKLHSEDDVSILICIGNNKMNDIRKAKYASIKARGYKIAQFVHPKAHLESNDLGEGNIILEGVSVGMGAKLGVCNVIWNGCNISHDTVIGDFNYIAPSTAIAGNTVVGDNCFLGIGSIVRSAVNIASYTFAGAGCYLDNDTEEGDVYVPARTVKLQKKSMEMPIN